MGRVLRQVLVAVVLAAVVVVCLRLGWWQLARYRSAAGSLQNLGYTLQWPTFAIFAVVMWWRLRALERDRRAAPTPDPAPTDSAPVVITSATVPGDDEPDDEHAAYNRYLAELNRRDR